MHVWDNNMSYVPVGNIFQIFIFVKHVPWTHVIAVFFVPSLFSAYRRLHWLHIALHAGLLPACSLLSCSLHAFVFNHCTHGTLYTPDSCTLDPCILIPWSPLFFSPLRLAGMQEEQTIKEYVWKHLYQQENEPITTGYGTAGGGQGFLCVLSNPPYRGRTKPPRGSDTIDY